MNDIFRILKDIVTAEVVGYLVCKGKKRGNAWWTTEIKKTIEGKRKTYQEILQRNVAGGTEREEISTSCGIANWSWSGDD